MGSKERGGEGGGGSVVGEGRGRVPVRRRDVKGAVSTCSACPLYTTDAADEEDSVDLGGRRIIKKKKKRPMITHNTNRQSLLLSPPTDLPIHLPLPYYFCHSSR